MQKVIKFCVEHKKAIMRIVLCMLFVAALTGGCSYLNQKVGLADDNIIEEALEQKIEQHTGLDLDLSPESKE